jgi:hypothetical protein
MTSTHVPSRRSKVRDTTITIILTPQNALERVRTLILHSVRLSGTPVARIETYHNLDIPSSTKVRPQNHTRVQTLSNISTSIPSPCIINLRATQCPPKPTKKHASPQNPPAEPRQPPYPNIPHTSLVSNASPATVPHATHTSNLPKTATIQRSTSTR